MPTFDDRSPEPLYQQVMRWVQEQIRSGRWPQRQKLPAEIDLAAALGISRGTLSRAVKELVVQGLLVQIHGKGTFVASADIEQPLAQRLAAFSEVLAERGIPYSTAVLRQATGEAPVEAISHLRLTPQQPVLHLSRIRLIEGEPVAYMENYVPLHLAPGLEQADFTHRGLFATLEQEYGLQLAHGHRTFEALAASEAIAVHLGVVPGAPVFYIEQVVYLADGQPVEYSEVWLRGNRFRLSALVHREAALPVHQGAGSRKLPF